MRARLPRTRFGWGRLSLAAALFVLALAGSEARATHGGPTVAEVLGVADGRLHWIEHEQTGEGLPPRLYSRALESDAEPEEWRPAGADDDALHRAFAAHLETLRSTLTPLTPLRRPVQIRTRARPDGVRYREGPRCARADRRCRRLALRQGRAVRAFALRVHLRSGVTRGRAALRSFQSPAAVVVRSYALPGAPQRVAVIRYRGVPMEGTYDAETVAVLRPR